jgi:hypothetical protein
MAFYTIIIIKHVRHGQNKIKIINYPDKTVMEKQADETSNQAGILENKFSDSALHN